MSNYPHFVTGLPQRCGDLLRTLEEPARMQDREVTLLLSLGMTSLVIPYERLKEPSNPDMPHPAHDREQYAVAQNRFAQLLEKPFLKSELWPTSDAASWCIGKLADVSGMPDQWPELQNPKAIGPNKGTKAVISILRRGLAHGNLFLRGYPNIETIVFLGQVDVKIYKFEYVTVSPDDFRQFLVNWIGFLKGVHLPEFIVLEDAEVSA